MKITFQFLSGKDAGNTREFDQPVVKIGRGEWNDLAFSDASQKMVSRNHAEVRLEGEAVNLVDLQSSFGTYINGEKISIRRLRPNDMIQFGTRGPEVCVTWRVSAGFPIDTGKTVLGADFPAGATVVVDSSAQAALLGTGPVSGPSVKSQSIMAKANSVDVTVPDMLSGPPAPPGKPQATVVFDPQKSPLTQGSPGAAFPGKPQATVVFDAQSGVGPGSGGVPPGGRAKAGAPGAGREPSGQTPAGPKSAAEGRGVGKETMAFLISDAVRKERERQGSSDPAPQAQLAMKSVSKMKVLVIGAASVLAVVMLAMFVQNIRLQNRLQEQEAKLSKTNAVSVDMLKQMGKSEEEIKKARQETEEATRKKLEETEKEMKKARQEAEEATRRKIEETEKRFQSILEQKDREYRAQIDEMKQKAGALEALNTKITKDRQESVAVSKQVTSSTEAAVVLIYCQYMLSNQENYDSHGSGFIISPDGKVITAKQVVEPWKFDPDIAAFIKAARLTLVKRDLYLWRTESKVRQGDTPNLATAFSTTAGTLSILKIAPDDMENQNYTREDTREKIGIRVHKANSGFNLAVLQLKGSTWPSVRVNTVSTGAEVTPGAAVMLYGYPLGVEQQVAKPELLRASLAKFGDVISIDKAITRGFVGAPLLLPDGSVIGLVLSEQYTIPLRLLIKLIG